MREALGLKENRKNSVKSVHRIDGGHGKSVWQDEQEKRD